MILVTGATGNVGRELVRQPAEDGEEVPALIRRDEDRARLPAGVHGVVGDLNAPQPWTPALSGLRAAHLLAGYDGLGELLAAMRDAGVERITLQSSSSVPQGDMTNAVARYHILSEQAVRDSGIAWTFIQPNSFMTNTLRWLPQLRAGDTIRLPFANVPIATIDPADIAAVAADERCDLLAVLGQLAHQLAPDVARRSGHQDHGRRCWRVRGLRATATSSTQRSALLVDVGARRASHPDIVYIPLTGMALCRSALLWRRGNTDAPVAAFARYTGSLCSELQSTRHAAVRYGRHGSAIFVSAAGVGSPGSP